jgi:hypothetical protein
VALLELYLARAPPWLFPRARDGGRPKHPHRLRQQITQAIQAELGLRLTPHPFWRATGLIFLTAHPGAHEVMRHLLGHRSIATTPSSSNGGRKGQPAPPHRARPMVEEPLPCPRLPPRLDRCGTLSPSSSAGISRARVRAGGS